MDWGFQINDNTCFCIYKMDGVAPSLRFTWITYKDWVLVLGVYQIGMFTVPF